MSLEPIALYNDARVSHRTALLNGRTYHYLYGEPQGQLYKATVFLVHGWPDLSMGWRYQIPMLLNMGLRVVAPDLMGFGGTDAPKVPPESLETYSVKRASDDFAELAKQLGAHEIVLGGHDWGGLVVWRMAAWHPQLVKYVFAVCTPYTEPRKQFVSTEALAKGPAPQLAYQIHLASPEVEQGVQTKEQIRSFLNGMYGARGPNGEGIFDPFKGILLENLPKIQDRSKLFSESEIEYYTEQYARNGMHGTLNWYRTREVNHKDDLELKTPIIGIPALYVRAIQDAVFPPSMMARMGKFIPKLTQVDVDGGHWILVQKAQEVNKALEDWLQKEVTWLKSQL